jgi:hypothetical protein
MEFLKSLGWIILSTLFFISLLVCISLAIFAIIDSAHIRDLLPPLLVSGGIVLVNIVVLFLSESYRDTVFKDLWPGLFWWPL